MANIFLADPNRFFTTDQLRTILAAIEDLQTVTTRVYDQCEECLQSALMQYRSLKTGATSAAGTSPHDSRPHSPTNLLRKSVSSMSGSFSGFSLVGSELSRGEGVGDSGVLVPRPGSGGIANANVKRGWDWREMVKGDAKGEDILRMLRSKLAQGLAFGELTDWIQ